MHLVPFEQLDDLPFSLTAEAVRARLGTPRRAGRNNVELDEMDYGGVVFRFQDNGRLEEISCARRCCIWAPWRCRSPTCPRLSGPRMRLVRTRGLSGQPALRPGLRAGQRGAWITALARHCLPQWEALRPH
jgi:hypothetical protein